MATTRAYENAVLSKVALKDKMSPALPTVLEEDDPLLLSAIQQLTDPDGMFSTTSEVENLKSMNEKLSSELSKYKTTLITYLNSFDKNRSDNERLKSDIEVLMQEKSDLELQIEALREIISSKDDTPVTNDTFQEAVGTLSTSIAEALRAIEEIRTSHRAQVERTEKVMGCVRATSTSLATNYDSLKEAISGLSSDIASIPVRTVSKIKIPK
jgi:chromosome segregation ATPase